jgi:hypothetical protein
MGMVYRIGYILFNTVEKPHTIILEWLHDSYWYNISFFLTLSSPNLQYHDTNSDGIITLVVNAAINGDNNIFSCEYLVQHPIIDFYDDKNYVTNHDLESR